MISTRKILLIGYGAVARCVLPILLRHITVPYQHITVVDFAEPPAELHAWMAQGIRFIQERLTPDNLPQMLASHAGPGGLVIDLSWNVDSVELMQWCHDHDTLYVNTSLEEWDPQAGMRSRSTLEKSLYTRHMQLRAAAAQWRSTAATAVLDHGANPGLISHFTRQGLADITRNRLEAPAVNNGEKRRLAELLDQQDFARLAMRLGVRVIHCSERDMQITSRPKEVDEFVGTWSIQGLYEECVAPAEIGWGTHEDPPSLAAVFPDDGPRNQIFLCQMGMNTWVRSWIPQQEIVGMVIRHGEAFTISDSLTVRDENGAAAYRPTVHYAYMPCHETLSSLHELRCRNYELQPKQRIMRDEIVQGKNVLGALLMGDCGAWWTGSSLDINEARRLVPHQNATTVQVAIGLAAAVLWMLEHPWQGLCVPDDLPYDRILALAKPYLGEFLSVPSDWTPFINSPVFFKEHPKVALHPANPWSFENFIFRP
ncbi:saccharopine dehydrogenase NADP-binding domain-containing protein [Candidatus Electronema sp. TJ]|uniref:saccharopine dehydrogenase NADP-binding domain-containing protein n=1 Tax=Candidatus Electronema sp. TJ TaxID=3401573 RepID=UPI003AA7D4AC